MRARCTVQNLTVDRGARRVLTDVTATLEPEQVVAVTGPNGVGKTTLVETMAGLLPATSGTVTWSALEGSPRAPESLRAVCLQSGGLPRQRSVGDFLALMARLYGSPRTPEQALAQVGLEGKHGDLIKTLSGGQNTRLRVAVSWITAAPVLLLDEPTSGLDAESAHTIRQVITSHRASGGSVLLVTHVFADVAECADVLWVLNDGSVNISDVGVLLPTVTFTSNLTRDQIVPTLPPDHDLFGDVSEDAQAGGVDSPLITASSTVQWRITGPQAADAALISALTAAALVHNTSISDWRVTTPEDRWKASFGVPE